MSRERIPNRTTNVIGVRLKNFFRKLLVAFDKAQRKKGSEIIRRYAHLKAVEFQAREQEQADPVLRGQFESLARGYLRLADQAARNAQFDVTPEPPPPKLDDPT
jgi:hypothetical protein